MILHTYQLDVSYTFYGDRICARDVEASSFDAPPGQSRQLTCVARYIDRRVLASNYADITTLADIVVEDSKELLFRTSNNILHQLAVNPHNTKIYYDTKYTSYPVGPVDLDNTVTHIHELTPYLDEYVPYSQAPYGSMVGYARYRDMTLAEYTEFTQRYNIRSPGDMQACLLLYRMYVVEYDTRVARCCDSIYFCEDYFLLHGADIAGQYRHIGLTG